MESLEELGDVFLLHYIQNVYENSGPWQPPVNTSPQMSAAITAYGRIYMHQFIQRDDCHYTDTDSVVLSNPLLEEDVSETKLGKFKLEYGGMQKLGIFLAPKCYALIPFDEAKLKERRIFFAIREFLKGMWKKSFFFQSVRFSF